MNNADNVPKQTVGISDYLRRLIKRMSLVVHIHGSVRTILVHANKSQTLTKDTKLSRYIMISTVAKCT